RRQSWWFCDASRLGKAKTSPVAGKRLLWFCLIDEGIGLHGAQVIPIQLESQANALHPDILHRCGGLENLHLHGCLSRGVKAKARMIVHGLVVRPYHQGVSGRKALDPESP